jgi:peptidoglycan/LPS O-acetylase OafA/YrhL
LILLIAQRRRFVGAGILRFGVLQYLGRISYGTYVYHFALFFFFADWMKWLGMKVQKAPNETVASFFVAVVFTYVIAALSWHLVEGPILRLKNVLAPTPRINEGAKTALQPV